MSSQRRLVTAPVLPVVLIQGSSDGGLRSVGDLLVALDRAQVAGDHGISAALVEQVYAAYDLAAEVLD